MNAEIIQICMVCQGEISRQPRTSGPTELSHGLHPGCTQEYLRASRDPAQLAEMNRRVRRHSAAFRAQGVA